MPQIEKAHPSGVKSNEYLFDKLPIVLLKMEKPKKNFLKKQIRKYALLFLSLPEGLMIILLKKD